MSALLRTHTLLLTLNPVPVPSTKADSSGLRQGLSRAVERNTRSSCRPAPLQSRAPPPLTRPAAALPGRRPPGLRQVQVGRPPSLPRAGALTLHPHQTRAHTAFPVSSAHPSSPGRQPAGQPALTCPTPPPLRPQSHAATLM